MTKWYVALPFALLFLFGLPFVSLGLKGEPWGFLVGVPMVGIGGWFFANKYEGTNG